MGNSKSVKIQFLTQEGQPNDFRDFDTNFNPEVQNREWQWRLIHSLCGPKGSTGAGEQAHQEKRKNPKLVKLVKEKCRGLIFQISDPSQAAAVNYELELPYRAGIPIVIFCSLPEGATAADVEKAVKSELSPALRTTTMHIVAHQGNSIPMEVRNQGMDWLMNTLNLPPIEGEEDLPDESLSLVVVGSAHVGKTSLLQRYVNDEFNPMQGPTMGIDKFTVKQEVRIPQKARNQTFILDIWDTAGEARYRTVTLAFYNSAHGFAVVFDVTQRESFDDVSQLWFDNIIQAKQTTPFGVVLVACKCDTPVDQWAITKEEIARFVDENEIAYVETSAKSPDGRGVIRDVFSQLVIRTATALSE